MATTRTVKAHDLKPGDLLMVRPAQSATNVFETIFDAYPEGDYVIVKFETTSMTLRLPVDYDVDVYN